MNTASNPFPGLRPFETEEYRLFFGREGQSDALIERLSHSRLLAVVGTSGSGKSSLVRAGLLPALRGGMMAGAGAGWRIAVMRPGHDPVGNLARALAEEGVLAEAGGGLPRAEGEAVIEATLRRGSLGLVEAARRARLSEHEQLLVVVDQFEELFRFRAARDAASTDDDASAFVKLLLEAARQRELSIYVVITMRSDFLGDCAQFQGLPEAINDGQYLIPRMTRDERRMAVVGPVRVARARMSEPLVNRLLNDVGDNPDQLPILQHALMRTWDYWSAHRRDSEPLGLSDYEAIGTMSDALSLHAEEAFGELSDERSRRVAEILFKALTERGPDNREIRRPTRLKEICEIAEASEAEVAAIVEVFRREGRSFLMPPADVALGPDTIIDISHESLIRNWQRLKEWVRDEAEGARIYRRLADAAVAYREGESGLLDEVTLRWVLRWRERYRPNRAWGVRYHPEYDAATRYLEESLAAREADAAERERKRREELERERHEREQAEAFAAEQERAARSLRRTARLLGVVSLIALAAVAVAIVLESRADAARQSAEAARQKLQKSRTALKDIQSYEMEQAEQELNEFYRLTANDEEGHENRAWVFYNLGDLNRKLERYDQAVAFFESALQTEITIHGRLGPDSVGTLDSLAHTLEDEKNYAAAVERYEQLADILTSVADRKGKYFRLNTANVHSDLANLYVTKALYDGAPVATGGGPESNEALMRLRHEAAVKARAKAEPHYRKAVAIWEDVLKDDPDSLAEKYREAADFFWRNFADAATSNNFLTKASSLERSTGTSLLRKPIGPSNPGGDPSINTQLAPEGAGYTVFNHDTARAYGRPETISFVQSLASAWAARHHDLKLVVADISRQGGGPLPPHLDHQDGREVDIWPLTSNGVAEPTNIYAPNYSRDLTTELINLIRQTNPSAVVYFDDPPLVASGLVRGTLDHNTYMHVLLP
jgi:tetratricopeptide (TPR) repeat protein